jgi:hypothetical protein
MVSPAFDPVDNHKSRQQIRGIHPPLNSDGPSAAAPACQHFVILVEDSLVSALEFRIIHHVVAPMFQRIADPGLQGDRPGSGPELGRGVWVRSVFLGQCGPGESQAQERHQEQRFFKRHVNLFKLAGAKNQNTLPILSGTNAPTTSAG